ncbi:hypothetical protein M0R72_14080 [Candidatus Pacearchaeota archaeon]|jgi:hypothetical protein|nr:hypothetical protein [Candidatus Pacearchaeota archaeon]
MKKLLIAIIITVIMLAGCANLQIQPAEKIALQIAAQRVGFYVAQNDPDIAPQAILIAQGIIAEKESTALKIAFTLAVAELVKQFPDDPLLKSDILLIAQGIKIDVPETKLDVKELEPIIAAFINGVKIGAGQ